MLWFLKKKKSVLRKKLDKLNNAQRIIENEYKETKQELRLTDYRIKRRL